MACHVPQCLGPQLERFEGWGVTQHWGTWNQLKALTHVVGWVTQQPGGPLECLHVGLECDLASLQRGGLPGVPVSGLETAY